MESWLSEFLGRPDLAHLILGKNDQVYMGRLAIERSVTLQADTQLLTSNQIILLSASLT